jgi:hypothetical protein
MRMLILTACVATLLYAGACSSPPQEIERKSAYEPIQVTERKMAFEPPDYTKDWRTIADLGYRQTYDPHVTQLYWKRLNWRMTLTGEWVDDLVEDMQRRYRWDKTLSEWVAEKGNPDWPE